MRLEVVKTILSVGSPFVSIPYWCDWKNSRARNFARLISVSIPYWCDWKNEVPNSKNHSKNVSIPYWCDWKDGTPLDIQAMSSFNSLLVRLEAVTKCASCIQRKRFYSQKTNHFLVYLQYYVFPLFSTTPHYQYVMTISLFFKPKCQRTFSVFSLSDDLPIK